MVTFSDAVGTVGKKKLRRGPRTIPDNFLEGNRNAWVQLLEESWLGVGLELLRIRDRRASTLADVRKAFDPVKDMPHNSGLAAPLYHSTVESAKPAEVLKMRRQVGDLDAEIVKAQAKLAEIERRAWEGKEGSKAVGPARGVGSEPCGKYGNFYCVYVGSARHA